MKVAHVFGVLLVVVVALVLPASGFAPHRRHMGAATHLRMGLFDGIAKAFSNEDFKSQDQRVRASHILIKGDDIDQVLGAVKTLFAEINSRTLDDKEALAGVFSDVARRESTCPSSAQGGDLGMFSPGKMVSEFDEALFPSDGSMTPPVGSVLGPIVTEFE